MIFRCVSKHIGNTVHSVEVYTVFYIIYIRNTLLNSLFISIVRNSDAKKSTLHFDSLSEVSTIYLFYKF